MTERDFFIDILKSTPDNSIVITTGQIDSQTAKRLGLISFKKFSPKHIDLTFEIESLNRNTWIEYFEQADITELLTHYWIYYQNKLIAIGVDYFETNDFDDTYYSSCFKEHLNIFNINFEEKVDNAFPILKLNRKIEIIKANVYQSNYSLEIAMEVNNEKLNLMFAIEKFDYDILQELFLELNQNEKLEFHGSYLGRDDVSDLVITLITFERETNLTIGATKQIIANLLWFQQIKDRKEVEKLIIKNCP